MGRTSICGFRNREETERCDKLEGTPPEHRTLGPVESEKPDRQLSRGVDPGLGHPSFNQNDTVNQSENYQLSGWQQAFFGTPFRCHVGGVLACSSLVVINALVWLDPNRFSDPKHTREQLEESIRLVASRDSLQTRFEAAEKVNALRHAEIEAVTEWLPAETSWSEMRRSIQLLAAECDVEVVGLDAGNEHLGSRVGVLDTHCEIQGRYHDICRFLHRLASQERPVWCDEARLVRPDRNLTVERVLETPDEDAGCTATLSLRMPFAGTGTAADRLLQLRRINGV